MADSSGSTTTSMRTTAAAIIIPSVEDLSAFVDRPTPPPSASKSKRKRFRFPTARLLASVRSMQFIKSFFVGVILVELVYINVTIFSVMGQQLPGAAAEYLSSNGSIPMSPPFDEHITARETLPLDFVIEGCTFNEDDVVREFKMPVRTSLLHSFSPQFERDAAKRFVDPAGELRNHAISPAIKWYHDQLVVVARISLNHERFTYGHKRTLNIPTDNWLYVQKFDRQLKPLTYGNLIAVPMTKTFEVGDGPIEPRLFVLDDRLMVTFNGMGHWKDNRFVDYTYMFDLEKQEMLAPDVAVSPIFAERNGKPPIDKHWLPFVLHGELHFVHNLEPLWVMKCTMRFACDWVYREVRQQGFIYDPTPFVGAFRGGTPFEQYDNSNYFISIAHNTLVKGTNAMRYYTAHLLVMHVEPYRMVYVSNAIQLHKDIFKPAPMQRYWDIEDDFMFPVGLVIEDLDSLVISTHINDANSILVRMTGLKRLMARLIKLDSRESPERGPPIGAINRKVKLMLEGFKKTYFI